MCQTTHAKTWPSKPREIRWSPVRSLLWWTCALGFAIGLQSDPNVGAIGASFVLSVASLGLGHSVGLHRGMIHRSFFSSRTFFRISAYLATLTGIGPVLRLMTVHDQRDYWQSQAVCPEWYSYDHGILRDWWWYLHCEHHPPAGQPLAPVHTAARFQDDPFLRFLDHTYLIQQVPIALGLVATFGMDGLVWGVFGRVLVATTGHWLVNYVAHTHGAMDWTVEGAGENGRNSMLFGFISMGEGWHNNHHAFPQSARFGLQWWQLDPGWWMVRFFSWMGVVWGVQEAPHCQGRVGLQATPPKP